MGGYCGIVEDLGSSGAGDAVFEQGDEFLGIRCWREAGLAGANDGEGFAGGKMGQGFFQGASEMELRRFGRHSQDGFAEAIDAVGGGFERLGNGIVRFAGDDDLDWVICEERSG